MRHTQDDGHGICTAGDCWLAFRLSSYMQVSSPEKYPKCLGWPHSVMHWQYGSVTAADPAAGLYAQRFTVNSTAVAKRLLQQPNELHGLLCGLSALKVGGCHRRERNTEAQCAFLGPVMQDNCPSSRQGMLGKVVNGSWTDCTFPHTMQLRRDTWHSVWTYLSGVGDSKLGTMIVITLVLPILTLAESLLCPNCRFHTRSAPEAKS